MNYADFKPPQEPPELPEVIQLNRDTEEISLILKNCIPLIENLKDSNDFNSQYWLCTALGRLNFAITCLEENRVYATAKIYIKKYGVDNN